jgi:hypothetical protein
VGGLRDGKPFLLEASILAALRLWPPLRPADTGSAGIVLGPLRLLYRAYSLAGPCYGYLTSSLQTFAAGTPSFAGTRLFMKFEIIFLSSLDAIYRPVALLFRRKAFPGGCSSALSPTNAISGDTALYFVLRFDE